MILSFFKSIKALALVYLLTSNSVPVHRCIHRCIKVKVVTTKGPVYCMKYDKLSIEGKIKTDCYDGFFCDYKKMSYHSAI